MNACCDPLVEIVVYMKPIQIGGTEVINNFIGYHIDQDPCRMIYCQQTLERAETYSKEILVPMLRDTPCLRHKVHDMRSRDTNSTILRKVYAGGSLTMVGANSPRGFRMTPQRKAVADDCDGFDTNAGDEGDPIALLIGRTTNFPDRTILLVSSPNDDVTSKINRAYQQSDQRIWEVPCPECGDYQPLMWSGITWPSPSHKGAWYSPTHDPDRTRYLCRACEYPIEHRSKFEMNRRGAWRAREPFTGVAGFWNNALISPFSTWTEIVRRYLQQKDDPAQLKVFVTQRLAEPWKVKLGTQLDYQGLFNRREVYEAQIPDGVVVLTAAVDVQESPARLEIEVKGWGVGEESWGIEHVVVHGRIDQPNFTAQKPEADTSPNVWRVLDEYLTRRWTLPNGISLSLACTFIDSSHRTNEVYTFVKPRQFRNIFAIKGSSESAAPIVNKPEKTRHGVMLIMLGTHTAKSTIYDRLQKPERGPGFYHWPMSYDEEYFKQVVAEKLTKKMRMGRPLLIWELPEGKKNEGLDLNVYNYCAVRWMIERQGADLQRLKDQLTASPSGPPPEPKDKKDWIPRPQPSRQAPRRGDWIRRR